MSIVGGLDIHRQQTTFDYLDTETGEVSVGQIPAADRRQLQAWLARRFGHCEDHGQIEFRWKGVPDGGMSTRNWPRPGW